MEGVSFIFLNKNTQTYICDHGEADEVHHHTGDANEDLFPVATAQICVKLIHYSSDEALYPYKL